MKIPKNLQVFCQYTRHKMTDSLRCFEILFVISTKEKFGFFNKNYNVMLKTIMYAKNHRESQRIFKNVNNTLRTPRFLKIFWNSLHPIKSAVPKSDIFTLRIPKNLCVHQLLQWFKLKILEDSLRFLTI